MNFIGKIDVAILRFFSNLDHWYWVDELMIIATNLLPASLVVAMLIMLIKPDYRSRAIIAMFALLLSVMMIEFLWKPMVMRPRPYLTHPWVKLIGKASSSYSFPSGHTSFAFAIAVGLYLGHRVKGFGWFLVIAFLSGFTRIYLGVHYLSDVFFGMIHGTLAALGSYLLYQSSLKNKKIRPA